MGYSHSSDTGSKIYDNILKDCKNSDRPKMTVIGKKELTKLREKEQTLFFNYY